MEDLSKLAKEENTPREYQRLKKLFPLFEWSWDAETNLARAKDGSATYNMKITNERCSWSEVDLATNHAERATKLYLQELYPFLTVSVYVGSKGFTVHAWDVRTGSSLGEGGTLLVAPDFHSKYTALNDLAYKASRIKGFVCTCCHEVKEASEHGFHHFASQYCKECAEKNPEAAKAAARETYE